MADKNTKGFDQEEMNETNQQEDQSKGGQASRTNEDYVQGTDQNQNSGHTQDSGSLGEESQGSELGEAEGQVEQPSQAGRDAE